MNLTISGHYVFTTQDGRASTGNVTQVYNFASSPTGNRLLAMGVFTSVAGQRRQQIFMLDLGASATLDPWYSAEFDQFCATVEPFWLQDASWAPDGSKVYVATTGYKPATDHDAHAGVYTGFFTSEPRGGLCDAAAAFSSAPAAGQRHAWVNYTGCDSLFSTAADAVTVYVGGHERWANNPNGCDKAGSGAITDPGLAGLDAASGTVIVDPSTPGTGKYSRGRGLGADDMLRTWAGLWIASDNAQNTDACGKTASGSAVHRHSGICFLPN